MKCQARIIKTYKTKKADSCYPVIPYMGAPNINAIGLETCEGDLTAEVGSYIDGGCGCCGNSEITLTLTCSRCKNAFVHLDLHSAMTSYAIQGFLDNLLEEYLK